MSDLLLKSIWAEKYKIVPTQLEKVKKVSSVATAFNTNIDAIFKITGKQLKKLIIDYNIPTDDLLKITQTSFNKPTDVILGIVKCFSRGIAEEWVTENIDIYHWLENNLGYQHLQMGGQAGIIANTLALLKIKKIIAHTNSLPALQAQQFLNLPNLYGFDKTGKLKKANSISRPSDIPLIHWIIEFDKNDSFTIDGHKFTCPKSNRFIATYDPLNMNLVMDTSFVNYLEHNKVDYLVLSGFHPLLSDNNGLKLIKKAVAVIKKWKKANEGLIVHLEVASTQDKIIRKAIVDDIAPLSDSAGLNERETIDLLQVMGKNKLAEKIEKETNACNLFEALMFLKQKLNIPRIQLHMFGLYITIQDTRYPYSAEQNLKGMMTAAVVSSSKAMIGYLNSYEDVGKTLGLPVSNQGLGELKKLAKKLDKPELAQTGVCQIGDYTVSATPTILIDKPKTLVGMGDTISSVSLLAGR